MSFGPDYDKSVPKMANSSVNFQAVQVINTSKRSLQEYTQDFMYIIAVISN